MPAYARGDPPAGGELAATRSVGSAAGAGKDLLGACSGGSGRSWSGTRGPGWGRPGTPGSGCSAGPFALLLRRAEARLDLAPGRELDGGPAIGEGGRAAGRVGE